MTSCIIPFHNEAENRGFGTVGIEPSGAWEHCPNRERAYGSGMIRLVFASESKDHLRPCREQYPTRYNDLSVIHID